MKVEVYEWLRMRYEKANYGYVTQCAFSVKRASEDSTRHFAVSNLNPWIMYTLGRSGVLSYYDGTSHTTKYTEPIHIDFRGDTTKVNGEDIGVPCNSSVIIGDPQKLDITDYLYSAISFKDGRVWKPCKLIDPYKGHQAGECAFIEENTNKLYFDPTNTGAFSVEGEALEVIGTTPCYNNIISKESKVAVRLREWIRPTLGAELYLGEAEKFVRMQVDANSTDEHYQFFYGDNSFIRATDNILGVFGTYKGVNLPYIGDIDIDLVAKEVRIGSTTWSIDNENFDNYRHAYIYGVGLFRIYNGLFRTKKIEVDDHIFHPAELALPYGTHPIGECCMIDLQSGDLYFNQGSGSFSCEGASLGYWQDKPLIDHYCDVEGSLHRSVQIFADNRERLKLIWEKNLPWSEHRWLVNDYTEAYTIIQGYTINERTIMDFSTKIESTNAAYPSILGIGRNYDDWENPGNYDFFFRKRSEGSADIVYRHTDVNGLNDTASNINSYNTIFTIHKESKKVIFNNKEVNINELYDLTIDRFAIFSLLKKMGDNVYYLQSSSSGAKIFISDFVITENGSEIFHLTPAILDRPTLASEDNNGIARKQGEAVFVNKARYKRGLPWCFGNVASSGSFSVSDYLIEGEDYERISGVVISSNQFVGVNYASTKWSDITISGDAIFASSMPSYICVKRGQYDAFDGKFIGLTHRNIYDLEFTHVINYDGNEAIFSKAKGSNILEVNGVSATLVDNYFTSLRLGYFGERSDLIVKAFEFSATDMSLNLIPVRLLRNIEPTCTHNNKGGKANEIGFFDTISGKFFGNDGQGEFSEYVP